MIKINLFHCIRLNLHLLNQTGKEGKTLIYIIISSPCFAAIVLLKDFFASVVKLFTILSEKVIINLKKRLNQNYLQCLQETGYTKEDLEKFKKRLQITNDFNEDHIPELNISELSNFVSSEIDTDWSLFWPLYISPDLAVLPRLSQLLRQFNRDAADIGTLNDDLIFGTDVIVHKASDTINLIKIITGSYDQLLKKYNEKLQEVEQKEKAVEKLKESLFSFQGQIHMIIAKLKKNIQQTKMLQLKLDTLEQKNKDDEHEHSEFLISVMKFKQIILPKSEKMIQNLEKKFNIKKEQFQQKVDELNDRNKEVEIVKDSLNIMKSKLKQIVLIKGGGLVAENITTQYGGSSIIKPLKIKLHTTLKSLSNQKIIFTKNNILFKDYDNDEISSILKHNGVQNKYIFHNNNKKLTSLLKILVLTKLQKINDRKRLNNLVDILNLKINSNKLSINKLKDILSQKIRF